MTEARMVMTGRIDPSGGSYRMVPVDALEFAQKIDNVTADLAVTVRLLHEAAEAKLKADRALEEALTQARLIAQAKGRSKEERDSITKIVHPGLIEAAEKAGLAHREAQRDQQLAQIAFDGLSLQLRFMEIINRS